MEAASLSQGQVLSLLWPKEDILPWGRVVRPSGGSLRPEGFLLSDKDVPFDFVPSVEPP